MATSPTSFQIPEPLHSFLLGLLAGNATAANLSQRVEVLIASFSQDLVYAISNGQQKPPKHVLLPNAVKTLTGNVELIRMLNRLGHGISYTQLEENETALCLQKLMATESHKVALTAAIKPFIFTTLAWDSIDRIEETLTGSGTSHRVNGIGVQKMTDESNVANELPAIERQKQRSVPSSFQELKVYIAGKRVGPNPLITGGPSFASPRSGSSTEKSDLDDGSTQ